MLEMSSREYKSLLFSAEKIDEIERKKRSIKYRKQIIIILKLILFILFVLHYFIRISYIVGQVSHLPIYIQLKA